MPRHDDSVQQVRYAAINCCLDLDFMGGAKWDTAVYLP